MKFSKLYKFCEGLFQSTVLNITLIRSKIEKFFRFDWHNQWKECDLWGSSSRTAATKVGYSIMRSPDVMWWGHASWFLHRSSIESLRVATLQYQRLPHNPFVHDSPYIQGYLFNDVWAATKLHCILAAMPLTALSSYPYFLFIATKQVWGRSFHRYFIVRQARNKSKARIWR